MARLLIPFVTGSDTRAVPVHGVHLDHHFESHDTSPVRSLR
jgi:hypothetical protein